MFPLKIVTFFKTLSATIFFSYLWHFSENPEPTEPLFILPEKVLETSCYIFRFRSCYVDF